MAGVLYMIPCPISDSTEVYDVNFALVDKQYVIGTGLYLNCATPGATLMFAGQVYAGKQVNELPFVGYNMGAYWKHWLDMGKKIPNPPAIFHVNWFRTDDEGHFIWPGFGDNMRVLLWILARCEGKVDAVETAIGFVPKAEDINIEGLDGVTLDTIRELLTIDNESWLEDVENIKAFYKQVGDRAPAELYEELAALEARLSK